MKVPTFQAQYSQTPMLQMQNQGFTPTKYPTGRPTFRSRDPVVRQGTLGEIGSFLQGIGSAGQAAAQIGGQIFDITNQYADSRAKIKMQDVKAGFAQYREQLLQSDDYINYGKMAKEFATNFHDDMAEEMGLQEKAFFNQYYSQFVNEELGGINEIANGLIKENIVNGHQVSISDAVQNRNPDKLVEEFNSAPKWLYKDYEEREKAYKDALSRIDVGLVQDYLDRLAPAEALVVLQGADLGLPVQYKTQEEKEIAEDALVSSMGEINMRERYPNAEVQGPSTKGWRITNEDGRSYFLTPEVAYKNGRLSKEEYDSITKGTKIKNAIEVTKDRVVRLEDEQINTLIGHYKKMKDLKDSQIFELSEGVRDEYGGRILDARVTYEDLLRVDVQLDQLFEAENMVYSHYKELKTLVEQGKSGFEKEWDKTKEAVIEQEENVREEALNAFKKEVTDRINKGEDMMQLLGSVTANRDLFASGEDYEQYMGMVRRSDDFYKSAYDQLEEQLREAGASEDEIARKVNEFHQSIFSRSVDAKGNLKPDRPSQIEIINEVREMTAPILEAKVLEFLRGRSQIYKRPGRRGLGENVLSDVEEVQDMLAQGLFAGFEEENKDVYFAEDVGIVPQQIKLYNEYVEKGVPASDGTVPAPIKTVALIDGQPVYFDQNDRPYAIYIEDNDEVLRPWNTLKLDKYTEFKVGYHKTTGKRIPVGKTASGEWEILSE